MRIAILAAITVDGKIARSSEELADWTSKEDKRFFVSKTKEAGIMVMGRKTYETIGRPLPERLIIVMTRNAADYQDLPGEVEFTSDSPQQIVERLKNQGSEMLVVAGGGEVYRLFLEADLVTDMFLTVEPIIFGSGVNFLDTVKEKQLERILVEELGKESVLLHYKII